MKGSQELFPEHAFRGGRPERESQPEVKVFSMPDQRRPGLELRAQVFLGSEGGNVVALPSEELACT